MDSPSAAPAALSGRRVALLGGFLLLGALAFVVWVLLSASPASAQAGDPSTTADSSASDQAGAPAPAPPESQAPPDDADAMGLPAFLGDLSAQLQQAAPPVTEVLPPPLQPVASNVVEALPAPVRAPIAPLLAPLAPPPSAAVPSNPPGGPVAGDPSTIAATTGPHAAAARAGSHAHRSGELSSTDLSSLGDGTRAPPTGIPAGVEASGSSVFSSPSPDSGSSLLLLGVLIAGVAVLLGPGRRLLFEALAWLPAPWCALPERPG